MMATTKKKEEEKCSVHSLNLAKMSEEGRTRGAAQTYRRETISFHLLLFCICSYFFLSQFDRKTQEFM